jgi:putative tryptophan/tyrosine transport system substrate-binding protein
MPVLSLGDKMRRREFITVLGGAAIWPLAARAQQMLKAAHIGYLAIRSPMSADDSFFRGLRNFGWIEGQNILIERRFTDGNANRLKEFSTAPSRRVCQLSNRLSSN